MDDRWQGALQGMREIRRERRGGDKVASLGPGTHVGLLYHTREEHQAALTEYVRGGLDRGERVLCIGTASDARQIRKYLRAAGFDPREAERRGQLRFLTPDEAYVREGAFDPQAMIALLRAETQDALEQGFTGLRVTGEMSWALRDLEGTKQLIEYEASLNSFFPGSACTGLCQYDTRLFPPKPFLTSSAPTPWSSQAPVSTKTLSTSRPRSSSAVRRRRSRSTGGLRSSKSAVTS